MHIWNLLCSITLLIGAFTCCAEQPADPPKADQTETIKKLIEKLNANDNISREDAERELLRIGSPALPLLKEATSSKEPEVAARAKRLVSKLAEHVTKPARSYAETVPADTLYFLETENAAQTLAKLRASPIGRFWDLPASKKFFKAHREGQLPSDQRLLDTIGEIGKLADSRALMYIGPADTADVAELDPPVVYLLETKQSQQLEGQIRALFDSLQDPPKSNRRYGPFTIEEHITAQTVFGQDCAVHALTQKSIEAYLDNRLKKPEKPLDPQLTDIRAALPGYDLLLHIGRRDFQALSDAAQIIDDEIIKGLDTYGLVEGTVLDAALSINENGIEEVVRLKVPDEPIPAKPEEKVTKKEGEPVEVKDPQADVKVEKRPKLMQLLKGMSTATPEAGKPAALDLIPWQSGLVLSFNGDVAKNAMALGQALRDIDALRAPPPAKRPEHKPPVLPATIPNKTEGEKAPDDKAPDAAKTNDPTPNTPGRQAMAEGAGPAPKDPKPPIVEPKVEAPAAPSYPTISRFEKIGIKLEQFMSQIDGPFHLALFPHQVGDDLPDVLPISPIVAILLKDPAQIEQSLDAAAAGPAPRFRREVLNGGSYYIDITTENPDGAGFWLKGNYLVYSTQKDLIDLSGLSLTHEKGNERITDRGAYKQAVAAKKITPDALLTIFAESDQALEMPYRVAKLNWQEDDANPWPEWALVKPLLQGKPILISVKATPDGLEAWGQTPLSIFGTAVAFRWPLLEAGFIKP